VTVPPRRPAAEEEAGNWADVMRTALAMARARRDRRRADYWRLADSVALDRTPLLVQCLAELCGSGRDDQWFTVRLDGLGAAEASGALLESVRDWQAQWDLNADP
jgi:hypothetical protein